MRHLVFSRRNLLHHEEGQTYETKAVAEIFNGNTATNQPQFRWLINCEQSIDSKGQVEDTAKREQSLLQSQRRYVVARQYRTCDEGNRTACTVEQTDCLVAQTKAAFCHRCFQEEGHHFHHEPFGKAVEYDEEQIVQDVFLLEEVYDHHSQVFERLVQGLFLLCYLLIARGQDKPVVQTEAEQQYGEDTHDISPRSEIGFDFCRAGLILQVFDQLSSQIHQTTRSHEFSQVVESALPADILRLCLLVQLLHVQTVQSHIVCRTTQSNYAKECHSDSPERRQLQTKGDQTEAQTCEQLSQYDVEFLSTIQLHQGTPQEF